MRGTDARHARRMRRACGPFAQRVDTAFMSETHAERVAAEVRAAMARHQTRQQAIAEALGLSQAAVSRRLTGAVEFTVSELDTVARVIGVPLAALLPTERVA